jgi:hypothetical protein
MVPAAAAGFPFGAASCFEVLVVVVEVGDEDYGDNGGDAEEKDVGYEGAQH